GQQALKAARVLIVGAGALGAPSALYLAAAGGGVLGLGDPDIVSVSNLQRQVLFGVEDLDRPKVEAAARRLAELNPNVRVEAIDQRVNEANARELVRGYDLVLD